jgi:hypothetical protein
LIGAIVIGVDQRSLGVISYFSISISVSVGLRIDRNELSESLIKLGGLSNRSLPGGMVVIFVSPIALNPVEFPLIVLNEAHPVTMNATQSTTALACTARNEKHMGYPE